MAMIATQVHAAPLGKGTVELSPAASFTHSSNSSSGGGGFSVTQIAAALGIGYCCSDKLEILGGFLLNHISGDFGDGTSGGLSAGVGLNFASESNVVPYLRGQVGFLANSGGADPSLIIPILEGAVGGLVGTGASVNFGAAYQHQTNALGITDVSGNVVGVQVGVSVFPKAGS